MERNVILCRGKTVPATERSLATVILTRGTPVRARSSPTVVDVDDAAEGDDGSTPSVGLAVLVGLAAVPFTYYLSSGAVAPDGGISVGGSISGTPLLLAGVIVGYLYGHRPASVRRAGIWAGVAGSLATVAVSLASGWTAIRSASAALSVVAVLATLFTLTVGVGLSVLVTSAAAMATDWVRGRIEGRNSGGDESVDGSVVDTSRRLVVAYVVAVPVAAVALYWSVTAGGSATAIAAVALLCTILLSVATLVALFTDLTALRHAATVWDPTWLYVGVPLSAGGLVYLVASATGSVNPAGDAVYGFVVALWAVAVAYLANSRRHAVTA